MSDVCQYGESNLAHSGKLHEWNVAVGGGAVAPVPSQQLECVGRLVFTMCEAHAATMISIPSLPLAEGGQCQCRICMQQQ